MTPYERWQLEKYGNILGETKLLETSNPETEPMTTAEENYIYQLENPE